MTNKLKRLCWLVLIFLSASHVWGDGRSLYYDWADTHKYQGTMMCTAIVKLNGQVLKNVELAAFDSKDELRGSVLSQDGTGEDGRCYLVIQGEGNKEVLHFRVVYGPDDDKRIIADANESFVFGMDKAIGTYYSPFIFNITSFIPGDVDGNGLVSIRDIAVLIDQLNHPSTINLERSDVDGNGVVNKGDVTALQHILLTK